MSSFSARCAAEDEADRLALVAASRRRPALFSAARWVWRELVLQLCPPGAWPVR